MKNKRIVILGGGESGSGAAVLAKKQGYDVFLSDFSNIKDIYIKRLTDFNIEFEQSIHTLDKILNADIVIKSPGISPENNVVKQIANSGIKIIDEIEFAYEFCNSKIIAITGSNGKTTTASLTYHIFKKAGLNVCLAGNIGQSFAFQLATQNFDYYILEISSFQLDYCFSFKPDIAVLLNITPDHLDRYDYSFEKYTQSKFRIIQNQSENDSFVYCADDKTITDYLDKTEIKPIKYSFSLKDNDTYTARIKENKIEIYIKQKLFTMQIEKLALQGKHNVYDSMAAAISSRLTDIKNHALQESLSDFMNVEHRLEFVAEVHGVEYINDSKATNVNSTWYALESINRKVVWIAGGQDKGNDYSELFDLVREKVTGIVCLGIENSKLKQSFKGLVSEIAEASTAEEAVYLASKMCSPGNVVLLSPACASFDLFENYEERGNKFKSAVLNL